MNFSRATPLQETTRKDWWFWLAASLWVLALIVVIWIVIYDTLSRDIGQSRVGPLFGALADLVGVLALVTTGAKTGEPTLEFEDGLVITVPQSSVALYGSGYNAGHLFLYGEEFGRSWYVALRLHENSPINGCYRIAGVAYDEPDSVIIVAGDEWPGVGLRLPKRGDFEVPDGAVGSLWPQDCGR